MADTTVVFRVNEKKIFTFSTSVKLGSYWISQSNLISLDGWMSRLIKIFYLVYPAASIKGLKLQKDKYNKKYSNKK